MPPHNEWTEADREAASALGHRKGASAQADAETGAHPSRWSRLVQVWTLYRAWLAFLRPHAGVLLPAYGLLLLAMVAEVAFPKALGFTIDHVLDESALSSGSADLPLVGSVAVDAALGTLLAVLLGLVALKTVSVYGRNMLLSWAGERVHIDMRGRLYEHLQKLPLGFFLSRPTGALVARLTTDTDALWRLLYSGSLNVIAPILTLVVILALMFQLHATLTLGVLCVLPVLFRMFARARREARVATHHQRERLSKIYAFLQEKVQAVRMVRLFGRGHREARLYRHQLIDLARRNMEMIRALHRLSTGSEAVTGAAVAVLLCAGGWAVTRGTLTLGELVQFYVYAGLLFQPIQRITNASADAFTQGEVALERIMGILSEEVSPVEGKQGGRRVAIEGRFVLENVHFAYGPDARVLRGLDMELPAGATVALVGISGAGKTTLFHLLCRFHAPDQGKITVDGIDLAELDPAAYRRQIGFVDQESFLFAATVAENIAYGLARCSRERIEEAARAAHAHEFISRLPRGYDTVLGERGMQLSGGQRQRINLARALVRRPRLLLLDEPTSALDLESEQRILQALRELQGSRTVCIIAHRLSTVRHADRIYVLDQGRIAESGDHETLWEARGKYYEWCRRSEGLRGE